MSIQASPTNETEKHGLGYYLLETWPWISILGVLAVSAIVIPMLAVASDAMLYIKAGLSGLTVCVVWGGLFFWLMGQAGGAPLNTEREKKSLKLWSIILGVFLIISNGAIWLLL